MTQKSFARKQRDAAKERAKEQLEDNKCWDDLNEIYNEAARLLHSHAAIAGYASDTDLHRYLPNPSLTVKNLKSLGSDLRQLSEELKGIKAEHANKTGGSDDADEVMGTFSIFEKYNLFTERHNAVVLPTAYQIVEEFAQAEQRRQQAHAAANAPTASDLAQSTAETGPIDVEVKEVSPADEVPVGTSDETPKLH